MQENIQKIKSMGYLVKLDTNGTNLNMLRYLVENKLIDYVAMDIKNPPELYARTAGLERLDIEAIERSKNFLLEGKVDYEFRTTAVKGLHTVESIAAAAKWIEGAKRYYIQCFAESGELIGEGFSAHDKNTLEAFCQAVFGHISSVEIRGI